MKCQGLPHLLSNEVFHCGQKSNLHFTKSFVKWGPSVFGTLKRRHFSDGVPDVFGQRFKLFTNVMFQLGLVLLAAFVEGCGNGTDKITNENDVGQFISDGKQKSSLWGL